METVFIALGSNLGDRRANLRSALKRMQSAELRLTRVSSLYETAPQGFTAQPWFLNQVAQAETVLTPRQLLARLVRIEREMGRRRGIPNGPRLIDLDILLYGNRVIRATGLRIPHPRMAERRFVLEPLAEIEAGLRPPSCKDTVGEMLAAVSGQAVRRIAGRRGLPITTVPATTSGRGGRP